MRLTINKRQILELNDHVIRESVCTFIKSLCLKNFETDFESKFQEGLKCYKNATYYGILKVDLIFKFIEIGFYHPTLAETVPFKGKLHQELQDYCPNQELQINFLESEFNCYFE
jgi:hypothetical protein